MCELIKKHSKSPNYTGKPINLHKTHKKLIMHNIPPLRLLICRTFSAFYPSGAVDCGFWSGVLSWRTIVHVLSSKQLLSIVSFSSVEWLEVGNYCLTAIGGLAQC